MLTVSLENWETKKKKVLELVKEEVKKNKIFGRSTSETFMKWKKGYYRLLMHIEKDNKYEELAKAVMKNCKLFSLVNNRNY